MESLDDAIAFLDRHLNRAVTLDVIDGEALASMRTLMRALGDPQTDVPVIQVTGTNGKGSTAAMISGLLSALGLSVGSFGSPYVSSITESIQRNNQNITPEEFVATMQVVEATVATLDFEPSHFELLTAAAYRFFADEAVDVAVVEVGMLGRYDATNIVDATVAVVTNIGYDHTDGRDDWRRRLAYEKAGIISPSSILCLGETDESIEDIFIAESPAEILRRHDQFDVLENLLAVGGRSVTLRSPAGLYEDIFISLFGEHQGSNAAIALAAAEAFVGTTLPDDVVTEGFGGLSLPGRFEVLGFEPLLVVDGAHNPDGARASIETLEEGFTVAGRRILVVGMMRDKDAKWILESLSAEDAEIVICTQADSPRALPAAELAAIARAEGYTAEIIADPPAALERALAVATEEDAILIVGSLAVVGEARNAFMVALAAQEAED